MDRRDRQFTREYKGSIFEVAIKFLPEQDVYEVEAVNREYQSVNRVMGEEWEKFPHVEEAVIKLTLDDCYTYIEGQEAQKNQIKEGYNDRGLHFMV